MGLRSRGLITVYTLPRTAGPAAKSSESGPWGQAGGGNFNWPCAILFPNKTETSEQIRQKLMFIGVGNGKLSDC